MRNVCLIGRSPIMMIEIFNQLVQGFNVTVFDEQIKFGGSWQFIKKDNKFFDLGCHILAPMLNYSNSEIYQFIEKIAKINLIQLYPKPVVPYKVSNHYIPEYDFNRWLTVFIIGLMVIINLFLEKVVSAENIHDKVVIKDDFNQSYVYDYLLIPNYHGCERINNIETKKRNKNL